MRAGGEGTNLYDALQLQELTQLHHKQHLKTEAPGVILKAWNPDILLHGKAIFIQIVAS